MDSKPLDRTLADYVYEHSSITDTKYNGEEKTSDVYFFKVIARNEPKIEDLKELVKNLNVLNDEEHSYIEIGANVGNQQLALRLMGLGELLGLWQVLEPRKFKIFDKDLMDKMAGVGYITIAPLSKKD
jgi:hypothetical protein